MAKAKRRHFFSRYRIPETASIPLRDSFSCAHPGCASSGYTYSDRGTGTPAHRATDIPGRPGKTEALAGRGGRIIFTGIQAGYEAFGKQVWIRHKRWYGKRHFARRLTSVLCHLDRIPVHPGQKVQPDTIVGIVGSTGNATGEHDHDELRRKPQDWSTAVPNYAWHEDARRRELAR